MIRGSCLCNGVRYEIDGAIGPALNCHCSMCRKATGAAFRSRVAVPSKRFRWTSGEDLLTRYESSPGTIRTFCRICGATLVSSLMIIQIPLDSRWGPSTTIREFVQRFMYSSGQRHNGMRSSTIYRNSTRFLPARWFEKMGRPFKRTSISITRA